jgi:hypothetical protein
MGRLSSLASADKSLVYILVKGGYAILVLSFRLLAGTLFLVWLIPRNRWRTDGAGPTKFFGQVVRVVIRIGLIVFPITLPRMFLAILTSRIYSEVAPSGVLTLPSSCTQVYGSLKN